MPVDATPRVVGRGRDADFVVLDARVSRQHLRVTGVEGGARLEVLDGAEAVLAGGVHRREAILRVGEAVVIGNTALSLVRGPREVDEAVRTDVRQLMTGLAADIRGLTAVMELVDALDAADEDAGLTAALRAWAQRNAEAIDVTLNVGPPAEATSESDEQFLVERAGPDPGTVVVAAAADAGRDSAQVVFTCRTVPSVHPSQPGQGSLVSPGGSLVSSGGSLASPTDRSAASAPALTDTTRRLLAIGARLTGSALVRLRSVQRVNEERELFRRVSLGGARSFLGDSPAAREISKLIGRLASSDAVVLREGETGSGKTFLARLLHESGPRARAPLRIINCAAIPDSLIESELFGHERGAFTGANAARTGALESARGGTVLLDEIGELPLASQAKLLRVLEERRFERLGSNRPIQLEARVLTATNRDLAAESAEGKFRRDLYYRIAVVKLRVPPLRDRGEDLVLLASQILGDLASSTGRRVEGFSPEAIEVIRRYSWPGNVRELRNAIERALVVGDGPRIEPVDFPEAVHGSVAQQPDDESLVRLPLPLHVLEERAIRAALRATGHNQRRAAALLGISRVTLHRRLRADSAQDPD